MRIAVLGANGQVGSEVCLLLRKVPGLEVVPVCRNPSGSAFLRWHGLACRHGSVGDPGQAPALVGDCDLVANFALAIGRPREARERNRRLIEQAALASPAGAKIVYFSTLSVYRRFRPANAPGGRTAYGDEKLRCERDARRVGRRLRKKTYVLRLGHVVGELQAIRQQLRQLLAAGPVVVPGGGDVPSNVVHTVTVVDALSRIAAGAPAGVYDLVSLPVWSWRQVLEEETRTLGTALAIEAPALDPFAAREGPLVAARAWTRRTASTLFAAPRMREAALSAIAHLPESVNLRLQSQHFRRRAGAEIGALRARPVSHEAFTVPPVVPRSLPGLAPTIDLLRGGAGEIGAPPRSGVVPP